MPFSVKSHSLLKLGQGSEDMEDQLTTGTVRINALLQRSKPHALCAHLFGTKDHILQRASKAVKPPDDWRIARTQGPQGLLEAMSIRFCTSSFVLKDLLNPAVCSASRCKSGVWSSVETRQ